MSEVVVANVGGSEWHHQGPQADGVTLLLREHRDHHVPSEHGHVGLLAGDHHLVQALGGTPVK